MVESWRQQVQETPRRPTLQLILGGSKAFPDQNGYTIHPVSSGSVPGSPPCGTRLENLQTEPSRRHLIRMPPFGGFWTLGHIIRGSSDILQLLNRWFRSFGVSLSGNAASSRSKKRSSVLTTASLTADRFKDDDKLFLVCLLKTFQNQRANVSSQIFTRPSIN